MAYSGLAFSVQSSASQAQAFKNAALFRSEKLRRSRIGGLFGSEKLCRSGIDGLFRSEKEHRSSASAVNGRRRCHVAIPGLLAGTARLRWEEFRYPGSSPFACHLFRRTRPPPLRADDLAYE